MPSAFHLAADSFSSDLPMHRVRRISAGMVWACRALMVLMPLALVVYWGWAGADQLAASAQLAPALLMAPLEPWQRWAGGAAMALPLGLLLVGVAKARRCFQQFALGDVFTLEATALLRGFAGWVAAAALGAIVATSVASGVLTLNNPPGMRQLAVAISSDHVFTLFFAATVWLMAAVIGQGQALVEENKGFV
ncbi:MAG: hypothetical protein WEK74_14510 [Hydrogenophaga sp.]